MCYYMQIPFDVKYYVDIKISYRLLTLIKHEDIDTIACFDKKTIINQWINIYNFYLFIYMDVIRKKSIVIEFTFLFHSVFLLMRN